uniref:Glutathione peroxidase 4 n=1 Tax=Lates calcarifer TaxID=8187 RepID=A0A4W6D7G2_LATCA
MRLIGSTVLFSVLLQAMSAPTEDWQTATSIYDFSATDIDGNVVSLEKYRGNVVIITNVFAEMHAKYAERGLRILAFPSNQFGNQEPGNESQIKQFAQSYNAQFDMFAKIDVNGPNAHPLWKWMKEQPNGKGFLGNSIKWNFTKFLINREGQVMKRYGPMDDPSVCTNILHYYRHYRDYSFCSTLVYHFIFSFSMWLWNHLLLGAC